MHARKCHDFRIWHNTYFVGCQEWGFSVWAHNRDCPAIEALITRLKGLGLDRAAVTVSRHFHTSDGSLVRGRSVEGFINLVTHQLVNLDRSRSFADSRRLVREAMLEAMIAADPHKEIWKLPVEYVPSPTAKVLFPLPDVLIPTQPASLKSSEIGRIRYNIYTDVDRDLLHDQLQGQMYGFIRMIQDSSMGLDFVRNRARRMENKAFREQQLEQGNIEREKWIQNYPGVIPAGYEALHEPDVRAAGLPAGLTRPGLGKVNSAIGGQAASIAEQIANLPDGTKWLKYDLGGGF